MQNENKFYKTKDCSVSSMLDCMGIKLNSVEWDSGSMYFFFENKQKCEEVVDKYYRDELKVNPKSLFDSSRNIKSIIYNN
jgi:hypothetical protein